jgi:hypothetical protein
MSNYKYLNFIEFGYDFEVESKINGKPMGYLILDLDGSYYFEPILLKGYWSSYWMKEICNKLDKLNQIYE